MNIVVCLKQVPDTSEVKLNPEPTPLSGTECRIS